MNAIDIIPTPLRQLQALLDALCIVAESEIDDEAIRDLAQQILPLALDLAVDAGLASISAEKTAVTQRRALEHALVVVAGCNADGAFDEQEQAIRAALMEAEGGAA